MAKSAPKTAPNTKRGSTLSGTPNLSTKAPKTTLPKSLVNSLPVGAEIIKHVQAIEDLIPKLAQQLTGANKGGAVALARAFVVLHRLQERLTSDKVSFKPFRILFQEYKEVICPAALEAEGITNVPLAEGFRVGVSSQTRASLKPDFKPECYAWLKTHYPDIVQETVNASTLSKLAREMMEENRELPEELFNVALVPTTSVTQTS